MTDHKYTAVQLRTAANITKVTYDQWRARGFIKSEQKSEGSGKPQLYSFAEVYRTTALARLVSLGISVSVAMMHVDNLYGFKGSRAYLVVRAYPDLEHDRMGDAIEHTGTSGEIIREQHLLSNITKYEGAVVISLDKIEQRVKSVLNP